MAMSLPSLSAPILTFIQNGERLPRPTRPNAVTAPLRPPPEPQLPSGKNGDTADIGKDMVDPIAECRQKALAAMASLLFDDADDMDSGSGDRRGGLQALVDGVGLGNGKQVDHTKILLHLSQAIDLQSKGKNRDALDELQRAVDAGLDHPAAHFDLSLL